MSVFTPSLPMGRTDLSAKGPFVVFRNKFVVDGKTHITYGVRKANTVLKSFATCAEAVKLQTEKYEKEGGDADE